MARAAKRRHSLAQCVSAGRAKGKEKESASADGTGFVTDSQAVGGFANL